MGGRHPAAQHGPMPPLPPTSRLATAALACAATLLTASSAHAWQLLGHTAAPSDPITCTFGGAVTIAGNGADYRAPAAGVITSMRTSNAGSFGASIMFRVFRESGANLVSIEHKSAPLTASGGALVDVRIPVQA